MRSANFFGLTRLTRAERREVRLFESADRGYAVSERHWNGKLRFKRNGGRKPRIAWEVSQCR